MSLRVEFDDLRKAFGPVEVLHGVSFNLEAGATYGLLGENGAGKSTLMKILAGYEQPTSGGFRVDGWVAPGGRRRIEARTADGSTEVRSDSTGRFSLPLVPPGHFQLVLQGDDTDAAPGPGPRPEPGGGAVRGPARPSRRAVVTPALTL